MCFRGGAAPQAQSRPPPRPAPRATPAKAKPKPKPQQKAQPQATRKQVQQSPPPYPRPKPKADTAPGQAFLAGSEGGDFDPQAFDDPMGAGYEAPMSPDYEDQMALGRQWIAEQLRPEAFQIAGSEGGDLQMPIPLAADQLGTSYEDQMAAQRDWIAKQLARRGPL